MAESCPMAGIELSLLRPGLRALGLGFIGLIGLIGLKLLVGLIGLIGFIGLVGFIIGFIGFRALGLGWLTVQGLGFWVEG